MITKPTKYTEEYVLTELKGFWDIIAFDPNIMFWADLIQDREYSRERVWEWKKKFKSVAEISNLIKKIDNEFETRLIKAGMVAKNPAMFIFVLKNHHGMRDKIETQENVKLKVIKTSVEQVDAPSNEIPTDESEIKLD